MSFIIRNFDDYHSIKNGVNPDVTAIELGCFPVKYAGYCKYFGLFYKEEKPSVNKVMDELDKQVAYDGIIHKNTGKFIQYSRENIEQAVEKALN